MRKAPALLAVAAAAAALFAGAAVAQAPAGGEHHGDGCMMKAMHEAGLSDEQKAKMKEIRESTAAGPDRREAMAKVMTDDQRAKVKASVEACRAAKQ
jgi:Spy/CpxP family protein refolding chaperone